MENSEFKKGDVVSVTRSDVLPLSIRAKEPMLHTVHRVTPSSIQLEIFDYGYWWVPKDYVVYGNINLQKLKDNYEF